MLSDEARENDYMSKVATVLNPLQEKVESIVLSGIKDGIPDEAIRTSVEDLIGRAAIDVEGVEFLDGVGETELDKMSGILERRLPEIVKDAVGLYPIGEEAQRKLLRIAASLYVRKTVSDDYTGIVIAGFGAREFMPRLRSFHFFGATFGISRIEDQGKCDIDGKENTADIFGFAQSDMVSTFTESMGPLVPYIAARAIKGGVLI